ncbi:MAG: hypothetical protein ACE5QF_10030 [Thermoplasmata archaeon]
MIDAAWVLVIATVGLIIATLVLAGFTLLLWKATVQLAQATEMLGRIEERRDQEEARRKQRNTVKRKLELAEEINDASSEEVFNVLAERGLPEEAKILRELRHLIDFDTDQVLRVDIDQILSAFDNVRAIRNEEIIGELRVVLERVQERLSWDFFRWRNEVNS